MIINKMNYHVRFLTWLVFFNYFLLSGFIHASSSTLVSPKDVFSVPSLAETQGVVVELVGSTNTYQGVAISNAPALRYAWKNGDFIFEAGSYTSTISNRLSTVRSAVGRFQGRVWEYSKSNLIQHGISNIYEQKFASKTAEELDFLQYLSKGMEIDDFATVEVKTDGTFSGKWLSTQPVQLMSGKLSFIDNGRVILNAWTPGRLVQFESEIEYNYSLSKTIPMSIKCRHIIEGEPSSYQIRRVVFMDANNSDPEFNPRLRYQIEKTLQLENDILSETNGSGKKTVYLTSNQTASPSKFRQSFVLLIMLASSVLIFGWFKNKK